MGWDYHHEMAPYDRRAGLNMEYFNCGNGYYYELINREKFIGVDID